MEPILSTISTGVQVVIGIAAVFALRSMNRANARWDEQLEELKQKREENRRVMETLSPHTQTLEIQTQALSTLLQRAS